MKSLLTILLILVVTSPLWPEGHCNPWALSENDVEIILSLRIPRILCAFFSGASLSLGGLLFQNLFKNVLATPYTLGVSAGASLMVAVGIFLDVAILGLPFLSFFGAFGVVLILLLATAVMKVFSVTKLLLMGVAIGLFSSSLISLLQLMGGKLGTFSYLIWILGSTDVYGRIPVLLCFLGLSCLTIFSFFRRSEITLLGISDSFALRTGVSVLKLQKEILFVTSFSVSLIISQVGPIGFVGLIIPNLIREIKGHLFRENYLVCLIFGGCFLSLLDTLSRLMSSFSLPIGAVMPIVGVPYLIYILLRR